MLRNVGTLALVALTATALLCAAGVMAPAKQGHIRYIDKLQIEKNFSDTFGAETPTQITVSSAPNDAGALTASFESLGNTAHFSVVPFLPETSGTPILSSSSSFNEEKPDNTLNLAMMFFDADKKSMIYNVSGDLAIDRAKRIIGSKDLNLKSSCLAVKTDKISTGQRVVTADINCDLGLKDVMQILLDNDLITKHAALSEQFFMQTGAYESIWSKFDQGIGADVAKTGLAFKAGSSLYVSFVTSPRSMDKGINVLYQKK